MYSLTLWRVHSRRGQKCDGGVLTVRGWVGGEKRGVVGWRRWEWDGRVNGEGKVVGTWRCGGEDDGEVVRWQRRRVTEMSWILFRMEV